jgi:hypothetical protein
MLLTLSLEVNRRSMVEAENIQFAHYKLKLRTAPNPLVLILGR